MTAKPKLTLAVAAIVVASLVFWAVQSPPAPPVVAGAPGSAPQVATGDVATGPPEASTGAAVPETVQRTSVTPAAKPKQSRLLARIVDPNGRPIAGARLAAPSREQLGEAWSDDDGQLVLVAKREHLRIWRDQAQPLLFQVSAAGHATRFVRAAIAPDTDTNLGELELGLGGVVVGRVVDADGTPLADTEVVAGQAALGRAPEQARIAGPLSEAGRLSARTDANGSYRLRGMAAGPGRVWAQVEDRGWAFTPAIEVLVGRDTLASDIVIGGIDAGQSIAGLVLAPDGSPVAGAVLLVAGSVDGSLRTKRVEADDEGRFSTAALSDSPHYVRAFHPQAELYPARTDAVRPGTTDLELRLAEIRWLEIALVDDRDGHLLEKPWVNVDAGGRLHLGEKVPEPHNEKLDNGRIRAPLPPGKFTVGASAKGYGHRQMGPFTADAVGSELVIELKRKQMIRGRVTGEGRPVAGARVQTVREIPAKYSMVTQGFRGRLFDGGAFAAKSDAEGLFEQPVSTAIQDGKHVLLVSKKGWATAELELDVGDDDVNEVEVVLTRGGAIEGFVWLPAGRDPAGALVAASNGNGFVLTARANEQGIYRFDTLTPGPWQLRYREQEQEFVTGFSAEPHDGPYRGDCTVVEGTTTRHNVDARGNSFQVRGQLRIDGQPGSSWTARLEEVRSYGSGQAGKSIVLDAFGAFALETEGKAHLLILETLAAGRPFTSLRKQLDLTSMPGPFDIALATGTLVGSAPSGTEFRVHIALADDWHYYVTPTLDAQGKFEVTVPAGTVEVATAEVAANGRKRWRDARTVQLVAGGRQSVTLP